MGSLFYISLLIIAAWSLHKDYRKTHGFLPQKIQHVFIIFFLFVTNIDAFNTFFSFIRNYKSFSEWSMTAQLEYMPIALSFMLTLVLRILAMSIYVLSFTLLVRADFARITLIWIIPFYILTMLPSLHLAYLNSFNSEAGSLAFGVVASFLAIYAIIFFVYKGEKMKRFFHAKKNAGVKNTPS